MNKYDENVPQSLKNMQEWFANIITRPIDDNSQMNPISPSGIPMTIEASQYIMSSPTLNPDQRIQLYNQQYWWRLLSTLHENFPLTTRLLGYRGFNDTIAVPFLEKYPPDNWSLSLLGAKLPQWVREEYDAEDKQLVQEAIDIDWTFIYSFYANEYPTLNSLESSEETDITTITLYHQPHLKLFPLHYNLLLFRQKVLEEEPDYWSNHDLPALGEEKKYWFVLYRDRRYNVSWLEIDNYEYSLLAQFAKGFTIEEACKFIESGDVELKKIATENLSNWFQKWTTRCWIGIK